MKKDPIDPRVYDLYDEYCHTQMTRRDFLNKASILTVVGGSALAMANALLPRYAENDPRVNASREEYRKALEANKKDFVMYTYEGTRHGFHNNSTPPYNEAQAKIAWERTMLFFKKHLS